MAGQSVGDLFVSLKIVGADKTVNAFSSVTSGMKNTKKMATETKVAIAAVFYEVERLMSQSLDRGSNAMSFEAMTGLKYQDVQRFWGAAVKTTKIGTKDIQSSLESFSKAIAPMDLMGEAPRFMATINNELSKRTGRGLKDRKSPTDLLMDFQRFYDLNIPGMTEAKKALMGTTLGITPDLMKAVKNHAFTEKNLKGVPVQSEGMMRNLDRLGGRWEILGERIQRDFDSFSSKHGDEMITSLNRIVISVELLTSAFEKLDKHIHVFTLIADLFAKGNEGLAFMTGGFAGFEKFKLKQSGFKDEKQLDDYLKFEDQVQKSFVDYLGKDITKEGKFRDILKSYKDKKTLLEEYKTLHPNIPVSPIQFGHGNKQASNNVNHNTVNLNVAGNMDKSVVSPISNQIKDALARTNFSQVT